MVQGWGWEGKRREDFWGWGWGVLKFYSERVGRQIDRWKDICWGFGGEGKSGLVLLDISLSFLGFYWSDKPGYCQ